MMKLMMWLSLGLTVLGALGGIGGSDESGPETVAEIALLAKVLGTPADDTRPAQTSPTRR